MGIDVEKKKWLAARRAQWRLKQRFETIDFEEALLEELAQLEERLSYGELPVLTIEENEDSPDHQEA